MIIRHPLITFRLAAACLLFLALLATSAMAQPQGRVTWIHDGDTLEVAGHGTVRLLGVDAPERKASRRDRFYVERYRIAETTLRRIAREALRFNIDYVKGERVVLSFGSERHDRHGRLLAYVHLPDGQLLNELLIEKGLAAVYRKYDFGRKAEFLAAEKQARAIGRGLWE